MCNVIVISGKNYAHELALMNVKMTDMRKTWKNLTAVPNKIYQMLEGNNNQVPDLPEEVVLPLQTKNDWKKLEEMSVFR